MAYLAFIGRILSGLGFYCYLWGRTRQSIHPCPVGSTGCALEVDSEQWIARNNGYVIHGYFQLLHRHLVNPVDCPRHPAWQ